MGFVILFNTALIFTLMRPRHASRIKGPLVEWAAFREAPYSLFTIGIFLALWGVYFASFYVGSSLFPPPPAFLRPPALPSFGGALPCLNESLFKPSLTYTRICRSLSLARPSSRSRHPHHSRF